MSVIIEDFISKLEKASSDIAQAKIDLVEAKKRIKVAKGQSNDKYIASTKEYLDSISSKPEETKAEIAKFKANLAEIKKLPNVTPDMIEYAKRELKDAQIRYKSAKKELRQAKKACIYARSAGDSDAIVAAQEEINNIKLVITKSNIACDRIICDAKAYIKKQQLIIRDNKELVTAQDAEAIKVTNDAQAEIKAAKEAISKAHKILPATYNFKKFYQEHTQGFEAFIALAPALSILIVFMFFPLVNTFVMSFMEGFQFETGGGAFAFNHKFTGIGFGEYIRVLRDPSFLKALRNTCVLVIASVPLTVIIALFISVALNGIKKLQGMYQTIFFLPYVTNTIALGMVFKILFATDNGLINSIFGSDIGWLTQDGTAGYWSSLVVITAYTVWNGLAFKILIFLSGLQSIDRQYYDAALIDGASKRRIFSKITVPLLSPMILYTVITSFIGAFKSYSHVIAVIGQGAYVFGPPTEPDMWITVVGYIYYQMTSYEAGTFSLAGAGSVILLIIILFITLIQFIVSKKRVHY